MQNKFNVGEVYKELRKARKISLKDVVRDKMSISQLSKFENGQTMIGADKMLEIIDGINITFYEFSFILRNFKPSKFQLLTGEIIKYSNLKSIDKLLELLSKHEKSDLIYDRLNCLLIKSAIFSLDSQYSLLNEDSKLLTSYLYEIESWSAYDLYLFGNTMIFLSNDDLIFLARELEKKIKFYSPLLEFSVGIKFTYMNLISELMVRKLKNEYAFFVKKLEGILDVYDTHFQIIFNFTKKIFSYLIEKNLTRDCVEKYIESTSKLGLVQLANLMKEKLKHYEEIIHKDK